MKAKVSKSGTNIAGMHLPINSIYIRLDVDYGDMLKGRRVCQRTYVWLTDIETASVRDVFSVHVMGANDTHPHMCTLNARRDECAQKLQAVAKTLHAEGAKVRNAVLLKEIRPLEPHDRKIPVPDTKRIPYKDFAVRPDVYTDYPVIDRCRVGKNMYSAEGYMSCRMGLPTANYGRR